MVQIIYDVSPGAGPDIAIPLGIVRRHILITIGSILAFTGIFSTFLFQRLSKNDNNLRQRGRYLVPIQGYATTVYVSIIYAYQSFKYRFPCASLYYGAYIALVAFLLAFTGRVWRLISRIDRNKAIYQSRFAEPADLTALGTTQSHAGGSGRELDKEIIIISASVSDSDPSLHTIPNPANRSQLGREKVFELSDKTLEEIAQSKKWYNRYRAATDMQMLLVGVAYMVVSIALAILSLRGAPYVSINPLSYMCRSGAEYIFPFASLILFLFLLSPYMIFQLKGIKDGFGIRDELIYVSVSSIPCVLLYLIVPRVAPEFTRKYLDKTTWVALILISAQTASILIPLFRHFKEYSRPCAYTARVLQRKSRDKSSAAGLPTLNDHSNSNKNNRDFERRRNVGNATMTPVPTAGDQYIAQDHYQAQNPLNDYASGENEARNIFGSKSVRPKNVLRNQKKERFGLGGGARQETTANIIKTDWHEFMRALEDRDLFDKISMFAVREFCAENTRFLYEVSRLEKRAVQYEHLQEMTSAYQVPTLDSAPQGTQQQQVEKGKDELPTIPRPTHSAKSASIATGHSTLAPLPTHLTSSRSQADLADVPHRIKKIVSASSVSSSMPMLGPRRSSSFEDSEPSSPLGSSPYSTFTSRGLSSTALPDLELGFSSEAAQVDYLSAHISAFSPMPMPPTLLIQFEYIYKTFIVSGGRLELNLSHDTSQNIHRKVKQGEWRSGLFDGAIYEVQELLFRDVWPKFVTSPQGLSYHGLNTPLEAAPQKDVAISSGNNSDSNLRTKSHSQTSVYLPYERQTTSRIATPSSIQLTSLKTSSSRATSLSVVDSATGGPSLSITDAATVGRTGSIASSTKTRQGRKEDVFQEEPSKTGFKTWLAKTSRNGMTPAGLISKEGNGEEAQGIIEQSRKSMVDRRSDTSALYSSSIQNTMTAPRPGFSS